MSKISYKLANKIAVFMAGDLFRVRIKYTEELLNEALTQVAKKSFPPALFKMIALYPQFFYTSDLIVVKGIKGGKFENVYVDGRIDFQIPKKPTYIEVDDTTITLLNEIYRRRSNLYERRAITCNDIAKRIYECKTVARLEKEFPEAYIVMLSIKSTEKET